MEKIFLFNFPESQAPLFVDSSRKSVRCLLADGEDPTAALSSRGGKGGRRRRRLSCCWKDFNYEQEEEEDYDSFTVVRCCMDNTASSWESVVRIDNDLISSLSSSSSCAKPQTLVSFLDKFSPLAEGNNKDDHHPVFTSRAGKDSLRAFCVHHFHNQWVRIGRHTACMMVLKQYDQVIRCLSVLVYMLYDLPRDTVGFWKGFWAEYFSLPPKERSAAFANSGCLDLLFLLQDTSSTGQPFFKRTCAEEVLLCDPRDSQRSPWESGYWKKHLKTFKRKSGRQRLCWKIRSAGDTNCTPMLLFRSGLLLYPSSVIQPPTSIPTPAFPLFVQDKILLIDGRLHVFGHGQGFVRVSSLTRGTKILFTGNVYRAVACLEKISLRPDSPLNILHLRPTLPCSFPTEDVFRIGCSSLHVNPPPSSKAATAPRVTATTRPSSEVVAQPRRRIEWWTEARLWTFALLSCFLPDDGEDISFFFQRSLLLRQWLLSKVPPPCSEREEEYARLLDESLPVDRYIPWCGYRGEWFVKRRIPPLFGGGVVAVGGWGSCGWDASLYDLPREKTVFLLARLEQYQFGHRLSLWKSKAIFYPNLDLITRNYSTFLWIHKRSFFQPNFKLNNDDSTEGRLRVSRTAGALYKIRFEDEVSLNGLQTAELGLLDFMEDSETGSCLAAESEVLTRRWGYISIENCLEQSVDHPRDANTLSSSPVEVWNGKRFVAMTIHRTSLKRYIWKVRFSNMCNLVCTPTHTLWIENKENGTLNEKPIHEISIHDKIIAFEIPDCRDSYLQSMNPSILKNTLHWILRHSSSNVRNTMVEMQQLVNGWPFPFLHEIFSEQQDALLDLHLFFQSVGIPSLIQGGTRLLFVLPEFLRTLGTEYGSDLLNEQGTMMDHKLVICPDAYVQSFKDWIRKIPITVERIERTLLERTTYCLRTTSPSSSFLTAEKTVVMVQGIAIGQGL